MHSPESTAGPLVDAEMLGRLLRAARIVAGFDRVEDAAQAVADTSGFHLTSRTLYALERGEQKATLEQLIAAVVAYRPPTGGGFFLQAVREDLREILDQTRRAQ